MHAMGKRIAAIKSGLLFSTFKRVLLQDSTTLALHPSLAGIYCGNKSNGKQKAVARLQCVINIKTMQWLDIVLQSFTNNDQSASGAVLPVLHKGDLLIRDLGYFVLDVFARIAQQQAFYISRLRYGVNLYDINGTQVNWKQLCKKEGIIDRMVLAGADQKLPVRIVMIPLPQQQVAEKIRKAKKDRDKRLNHSDDYYLWLGYNVFITNVPATMLDTKQIAEVYKVRWQIEILFKSWKTGLRMQDMLHDGCTNVHRVNTSIYLVLMFCCLVVQHLYMPFEKKVFKHTAKQLSLLKVCSYVYNNLASVIKLSAKKLEKALIKYCCYDSRSDRLNMTETIGKYHLG